MENIPPHSDRLFRVSGKLCKSSLQYDFEELRCVRLSSLFIISCVRHTRALQRLRMTKSGRVEVEAMNLNASDVEAKGVLNFTKFQNDSLKVRVSLPSLLAEYWTHVSPLSSDHLRETHHNHSAVRWGSLTGTNTVIILIHAFFLLNCIMSVAWIEEADRGAQWMGWRARFRG